jgi:hypothetical protein
MKAADKLSKKEAWPFDQRPRPILAHGEQCQLFVTIGALVAFALAACGAILVLAAFRATRARSLDRCDRRYEGESDSSDECIHNFSYLCENSKLVVPEKIGPCANSDRDSRRRNRRSATTLIGPLVAEIPTESGLKNMLGEFFLSN